MQHNKPQSNAWPDETMKGLLITTIVVGHNYVLAKEVPYLFGLLYFWHVQGFFFLAAAKRNFEQNPQKISTILIRYLVPFLIFMVSVWFAESILKSNFSVNDIVAALIFGSAELSDKATGLALFWFLPTFASFLIIFQSYFTVTSSAGPGAKISFLLIFVFPMVIFFVPKNVMAHAPLNAILACYLITGAFLFRITLSWLNVNIVVKYSMLLLSVVVLTVQFVFIVFLGDKINVSVYQFGFSIFEVYLGVFASVCANLLIFEGSKYLKNIYVIKLIGKNSLYVYLFHQFFQAPATLLIGHYVQHGSLSGMLLAILSVVTSITFAVALGRLVEKLSSVKQIVFPKDLSSILSATRLSVKR